MPVYSQYTWNIWRPNGLWLDQFKETEKPARGLRVENVVSEEAMVNSTDIIVMNGNEIQSGHEAQRMDR